MKILNYGNLAIVLTLILCLVLSKLYPKCSEIAFILGLFVMPPYQLLAGFIWWMVSNENKKIRNYFIGVICYFILVFSFLAVDNLLSKIKILEYIAFAFFSGTPVLLALYFTFILNQFTRK